VVGSSKEDGEEPRREARLTERRVADEAGGGAHGREEAAAGGVCE
jgi:hypothetical protein